MLTGIEGKVMAYDGENRPLSVFKAGKCSAYVYGADGTRLKKIEVAKASATDCQAVTATTPGAKVTVTFGMQEFRNYGKGTADEILSYPLPNIRFTATAANRTHSVLHRDPQGSVLAITNSAGARVQSGSGFYCKPIANRVRASREAANCDAILT